MENESLIHLGTQSALAFTLPSTMTIENAELVAADLKQLSFTEKADLIIDASHVEHITTPGLQLLIALEKTLTAQGGTLMIKNGRPSFTQAFLEAGIDNLLK